MARLHYPQIIETDKKYTALADLGLRVGQIDLSLMMTNFIDLVPNEFLQLLAEKWSVTSYDGWLLAESDSAKRKLIKRAVELHRYKGTPWAIREIIRQLGFGEVEIIERLSGQKRDGSIRRNAVYFHGQKSKWAHYRIVFKRPLTLDQGKLIQSTLRHFSPARCVLESLDYQQVANRHNGKIKRDGTFTRGMVKLNK